MKARILTLLWLAFLAAACLPAAAEDRMTEPVKSAVDPYALSLIGRASKFLGNAKNAAFTSEISEDILVEDGAPVLQGSRTLDVRLRRPDRLIVEVRNAAPLRTFYYDGRNVTIHDHVAETFAEIKTPATIDETLDLANDKFNIFFPVEDLLISKPFGGGADKAKSGQYLGMDRIQATNCHHVAFQNDTIHWEAWIQDGPLPLVRKVVLRSQDEGALPLTALLSNWDLQTAHTEDAFQFIPPPGVVKIEAVASGGDSN